MSDLRLQNWQSVREEVLRRINTHEWKPGDQIPNEAELAHEFGCARSTVNRALRAIAETGLLDRRRKAGTRVAEQPVARATLDIPVIRKEIEERGQRYRHQLIERAVMIPPSSVSAAMGTGAKAQLLRLMALHLANGQPFALEDRWVNPEAVPDAENEPFANINANEWLLKHAPYTHGEIAFSAQNASPAEAEAMNCKPGTALFVIDRLTWNRDCAVTRVRILFAQGHQLHAAL